MQPSPSLSAEISRRLEEARRSTPARVSPDGTALMLYGDIGGCAYIRPDGDVHFVAHDEHVAYREPEAVVVASLVIGSKHFPELKELLPQRSPAARDCSACAGTGKFKDFDIICGTCNGLGWTSAA